MRIIEVTLDKQIVWQYGQTGVSGEGPDQLNNPNSAELLANGHILIADENNNRVIEVNRKTANRLELRMRHLHATQRCRFRQPPAEWRYVDHRFQQQPHRRSGFQRQDGLDILSRIPALAASRHLFRPARCV